MLTLTGLRTDKVIAIISGLPKKDGGCGHKHNFAVDSANKRLYVSDMGAVCLAIALAERKGRD